MFAVERTRVAGGACVAVARNAAEATGVSLQLRDMPPRVITLLMLTGLDGMLTIEAVPAADGEWPAPEPELP